MSLEKATEPIIDNIILDSSNAGVGEEQDNDLVLFSSLTKDAVQLVPYKMVPLSIEYPQLYTPKCSICNSPHRDLLEHYYIECGKKINAVITFFAKHYGAKLNWAQIKTHVTHHCDFNKIETPGLLDYEGREEDLSRWKYREYELVEIALLTELNDVRGIPARRGDDIIKRAAMIEKLTKQLLLVKEKRDDSTYSLPNVFEVLAELHSLMNNEDDKRIIREKVRFLQKSIS